MIDPELQARVERKLDLNERLVWAGKPVLFFAEDGREEPLPLIIGICIFFVPFVSIGVCMLGAPLWTRLRTPHWVYAVTNKRALIIGRFRTRDWRASELRFVDRADHRNGRSDLFFAHDGGNGNGTRCPTGFHNLPTAEASAAESALRTLMKGRNNA